MIWVIAGILFILLIIKLKPKKYHFEKELMKCESPIEVKMIEELYAAGYCPYSQVKCGNYRIDLAIYSKGKKLAIECDGKEYHTSPKQVVHDQKKNYYLSKHRWKVVRFRGVDIYKKMPWCLSIIEKRMNE